VLVGIPTKPIEFPFDNIILPEKDLIPVQAYVDEFPAAIPLLASGKIDSNILITDRIKLNDIVEKGFKVLAGKQKAKHIKILVSPEEL